MRYIERGRLDVLDGAFVVVDVTGVRTHIPVGGVACLMLGPGATSAPPRPIKLVGSGVSLLDGKGFLRGKKWKRR